MDQQARFLAALGDPNILSPLRKGKKTAPISSPPISPEECNKRMADFLARAGDPNRPLPSIRKRKTSAFPQKNSQSFLSRL